MKKKADEKQGPSIGFSIRTYLKKNIGLLVVLFFTYLIVIGISFAKIATSSTISSFNLNDYEVGQIADITIKASKALPADMLNPISVEKDEKIIRKGFQITEEAYAKLKRLSESPAYIDYRAFADSVIYHLLMIVLFFFFSHILFRKKKLTIKELVTECIFYVLIYLLTVIACKSSFFSTSMSRMIIIPSCFCVYIIAILFGELNAVFFSIVISFAVFNASSYDVLSFFYTLSISFSAVRIVRNIARRVDMVFVSLLQALLSVVFLTIFKLIFNETFTSPLLEIGGLAFNGLISGILCLGMLTPLELLLNTASPFRLMDLSDLNNPIMKKMLVTASGTYNHSMMVASLAEAACNEIGANALLARVGAYYHDIGKIDNPEYFVENQQSCENLHANINPSLSVSIIRSHVKRGLEKAHALRLPQQICNIISEHHGNQVIAYFYNEAKQKDENVNPEDYSYTGTPPTSCESAVVMLADTVEAACRTLEKPSVPRLDKFIWTLINSKIEHHQLDHCGLTFENLAQIHDSFVQLLAGYYHSRIEYPDQKDPDSKTNSEKKEVEIVQEKKERTLSENNKVKKERTLSENNASKKERTLSENNPVKKEKTLSENKNSSRKNKNTKEK